MKKLLAFIASALISFSALAAYTPPLEYGVATTITFDLYNTDGTLDVDEADGGSEVTLYCDEAAGATATNDFVDEGPYYSLALTAAEMQCARLVVSIGATDTNNIHIWTIGSANAQVDDDGGWLDAIPYNNSWDADFESEVTDALNAYDPPTNAELTSAVANVSVDEMQASALADFFNTDSGTTYASAVSGSVVSETADNAGGSALTAAAIVDEWESQSQADPTGFHVNVIEIGGTSQTANDNGADINSILTDTAAIPSFPTNFSDLDIEPTTGHVDVGYWNGTEITTALQTAEDVVDEWESQSQADPTGFHVNVIEIGGTSQTANDNGADINAILADTNELQTDDYPSRFTGIEGATFNSSTDCLECIRDRGDSAWVTGAGGSAPTVEEIRSEIDSNSTQLAAIVADTNELQTDDVPGLISALNDLSAAEVNTEVDNAIETYHLDHLLAVDYDPSSKPGNGTALMNELVENDGGVSRFTVNALENAPSGSGASAEAIVNEWEAQSQADPTGFHVNVKEVNGTSQTAGDFAALIAALNDLSQAEAQTAAAAALAAYDPPTDAEMDTAFAALNDISVVDIRGMVIDNQGAVTLGCAMAASLARLAGDWSGTTSVIYQDATGSETRVTVDLGTSDQRDSTITCPTY